jgi:DNA-binding response OmpR family regulator
MLTARGRAEDVLRGFECGADDYLTKPFELPIVLARVRGLLRRHEWSRQPIQNGDVFTFDGRTLDFQNLELHMEGKTLQLTLMEANLLRLLVQNEGKAVSRRAILEKVWGLREDTDTRAIDNFVVRLRRYIEADPAHPAHLLTVRGVGYKFVQ